MMTRRGFLRFAPLARWLAGSVPAVAITNTRRALRISSEAAARIHYGAPIGNHVEGYVFDDIETEAPLCNPTVRVSIEGGPVLWEEESHWPSSGFDFRRQREELPWHQESLVERLLERRPK